MAKKVVKGTVHIFGNSPLPWRIGNEVDRAIYDAEDKLIGMMNRRQDAIAVVMAVNLWKDRQP